MNRRSGRKEPKVGPCIYCADGEPKELSEEHYLPRCLGVFRGYEELDDRICHPCNNSFSVLEEQFCRSSPEAFFRELLAVEGRRGHKKSSPFYRGYAGGDRLILEGKFPGEDFNVLWELNRGTRTVNFLRQLILFTDDGRTHIIPIPDDMRDPAQLRAEFDELGIGKAKAARIFAAQSEFAWVESLLSGLKIERQLDWEPTTEGGAPTTILTFKVTDRYFRAVAKVGFHYFVKHMRPFFHGSEDVFAGVRDYITEGGENRFVTWGMNQMVGNLYFGERPTTYMHVIGAGINYRELWCKLQFFLGPDYLSPVYTVMLGRNPSRIVYEESRIHSYEYFPEGKQEGFDGVMNEGRTSRRSFVP